MRYAVRPERLDDATRWMARVAAQWDDRLAAVKRLAEARLDTEEIEMLLQDKNA